MKTAACLRGYSVGNIDSSRSESHFAAMTYEYLCTACAFSWEAEQSISEKPLTTCPSCNAETAKRQVSGGQGFILRGGGWYADGYGAKKASTESAPSTKVESTPKADPQPAKPATPATSDKAGS